MSAARGAPPARPRGRARPMLPAASLLVAGTLAGCGPFGDGDEATSNPEEVARQGDEICRQAQERVNELRAHPPRSAAESARFTESLIEVYRDEVSSLRSLEPPEDRRAALDRYVETREKAIVLLEQGRDAAEREDAEAYAEAQAEVAAGQVERAELAQRAGFRDCSRPQGAGAAAPE